MSNLIKIQQIFLKKFRTKTGEKNIPEYKKYIFTKEIF